MKKNILNTLITLTAIFAVSACSSTESSGVQLLRGPEGLDHSYSYDQTRQTSYLSFKDKMRSFSSKVSVSFAKAHSERGDNVTMSPLSLELCLGMAVPSSDGVTREELLNAFDIDYTSFDNYYKLFFDDLSFEIENSPKEVASQLLLTNSVWVDNEVPLLDKGLDKLVNNYYAYVYECDFNGANRRTNRAMNRFVREKTNDLLSPQFDLPTTTMFVFLNTVYLKDIWNDAGDDLAYAKEEYKFVDYEGNISEKRLLEGKYNKGKIINGDDYSSFFTRTEHGLNLYFIKPNDDSGKSALDVFTEENINYVLNSDNYVYQDDEKHERYFTNCVFPEYEASSHFDVKDLLINDFGVESIFNTTCDFSNLSNNQVWCDEMQQFAKLRVDKKGIEGAAVTYIAYAGAAGPDGYEEIYETFVVDKEFGFVLTNSSNDIIFSGVVTTID